QSRECTLGFIITPELHENAGTQGMIWLAQISRHFDNTRIEYRKRLRITLLLIVELAEMNPDTRCQLIIHGPGQQLVKQRFCLTRHAVAGIQRTQQDLCTLRLSWQRTRFQREKNMTQRSKLLPLVIVVENLAIGRVDHRVRTIKTPVTLRRDDLQTQQACQKENSDAHRMHYFQL